MGWKSLIALIILAVVMLLILVSGSVAIMFLGNSDKDGASKNNDL